MEKSDFNQDSKSKKKHGKKNSDSEDNYSDSEDNFSEEENEEVSIEVTDSEKEDQQQQGGIEDEVKQLEKKSTRRKRVRLLPNRREFRMRAHINPHQITYYDYPINPDFVDWSVHFPRYFGVEDKSEWFKIKNNTKSYPIKYSFPVEPRLNGLEKGVDFLDVGCGYGGLLFSLHQTFPGKLILGMEIRDKLVDYIGLKIKALREHKDCYHEVGVLRTNAMKHMLQYLRKESVEKMFFCFPDPQFKKKKHGRRIINTGLLSEYAYLLKKGARLYTITDVPDLHAWHLEKLSTHNQFKQLTEEQIKDDPCIPLIHNTTEESKKVDRKTGEKYYLVFEKI